MCARCAEQGDYVLTIKLVSLGLGFLSNSGIVDVAQPLLDSLAEESGELVRLAVVDGDDLTFVAKAQGATPRPALRPRHGPVGAPLVQLRRPRLAVDHERRRGLQLVAKQGFGNPKDYGPKAPTTVKALLAYLQRGTQARLQHDQRGVRPAMTAMAAPVRTQRAR
jgi:IclR family acetate operon transcriptional repressor